MNFADDRRRRHISQHVGNIHRLLTIRWNKRSGNRIIQVDREKYRASIIARGGALKVFYANAHTVPAFNYFQAQAAELDHRRASTHIGFEGGPGLYFCVEL